MYRSEGQVAFMGHSTAAGQDAALNPMSPVGSRPAFAPFDIANTSVFLAGDTGASISGTSLNVALGYSAFYTC